MKLELAKVNPVSVNKVSTTPIEVANQGQAISANMLNPIAIFPVLVICQRINPKTATAPQAKLNLLSFHSAFLFKNEATNIRNGSIPATNVINAKRNPTPSFICAVNAISGANDHSRKETLFGFTLPFIVAIR